MSYIDGFIIPVATAKQPEITDHANRMDKFFIEYGATRVVEGWADDVPDGTVTDFKRAVQATPDETALFSWIEWPDKQTRDAAMEKMQSNQAMTDEPMTCSVVALPDRFCPGGPRKVEPAPARIASHGASWNLARTCGLKVDPTLPP